MPIRARSSRPKAASSSADARMSSSEQGRIGMARDACAEEVREVVYGDLPGRGEPPEHGRVVAEKPFRTLDERWVDDLRQFVMVERTLEFADYLPALEGDIHRDIPAGMVLPAEGVEGLEQVVDDVAVDQCMECGGGLGLAELVHDMGDVVEPSCHHGEELVHLLHAVLGKSGGLSRAARVQFRDARQESGVVLDGVEHAETVVCREHPSVPGADRLDTAAGEERPYSGPGIGSTPPGSIRRCPRSPDLQRRAGRR